MAYIFIALFVSCSMTELFEEFYPEAEKIMKNMTIEQKIGQLFFPRFNNETKDSDITTRFPGGFVLFGKDFNETENVVINNIEYIQNLSQKTMKLPLGLAVDEEGGTVYRVSKYHRKEGIFPSPHNIYNASGLEGILKIDQEKRDLLRKFKINVNLAPVADMSDDPNDFIYDRTLGYSLNETMKYIEKDVEGYVKDNFTCCAKHFPGYGNNVDTHGEVAVDNRTYENFLDRDLKPFQSGITSKIPMILVSHNIVLCKDKDYPASISKVWHEILRNDLNYSGLIATDDLSMDAIKKYSGGMSPAILAVNSGNDIILTSQFYEHLNATIAAVKNNTISMEVIERACKRILAWKIKYLGARYIEGDGKGQDDGKGDDDGKEKEKKEEKNEPASDNTLLIIILSLVCAIVLGIIIYFVLRQFYCKKQVNDNDIERIAPDTNLL